MHQLNVGHQAEHVPSFLLRFDLVQLARHAIVQLVHLERQRLALVVVDSLLPPTPQNTQAKGVSTN